MIVGYSCKTKKKINLLTNMNLRLTLVCQIAVERHRDAFIFSLYVDSDCLRIALIIQEINLHSLNSLKNIKKCKTVK